MKRIGMTVAVLWAAGFALLAPGAAEACERHRAPASTEARPDAKAEAAQEALQELDTLLAAKCQCGSAADCTCKKGACECAKCQKPKRQVMDALRGQKKAAPKLQDARYDASAGIFI